jgi:tetratricopeptide (TPR) repeat protein
LIFFIRLDLPMACTATSTALMHLHLALHALTLKAVPFRGWRVVRRGIFVSLLVLMGSWVRADVYTEVNFQITSGQYQTAQSLITRHLEKQPSDPQMRLMQSQIQAAQGQLSLAQETLEALTQEFPELPEPYNNLAALYARQNAFEKALNSLALAIRARPDYALALENMGDVHVALARESYLKSKALPSQSPLVSLRLDTKIKLLGPVLQPLKP